MTREREVKWFERKERVVRKKRKSGGKLVVEVSCRSKLVVVGAKCVTGRMGFNGTFEGLSFASLSKHIQRTLHALFVSSHCATPYLVQCQLA